MRRTFDVLTFELDFVDDSMEHRKMIEHHLLVTSN